VPSITSWTRLEPDAAAGDLQVALTARVLDPLWLITRQWQFGEFQGEDTGTPVMARVRASTTMLTRIHLGELPPNSQIQAPAYDPAAVPIEVMVERRPARPRGPADPSALRFAVEAGLHFLRMLAAQPLSQDYRDAFVRRFALQAPDPASAAGLDGDTRRFLALMVGRAVDARALEVACRASSPPALDADPVLGIAASDRAEVRDAAIAWLAWYESLFSEPGAADDAWVPGRLEYHVSVAARLSPDPFDERTLSATQFAGGRLHWNSFDINAEVRTGTDGDAAVTSVTRTVVPAPVHVPGGPAARFWQFEDGRLDYSRLATTPTDLVHLLLTEYASSYGNDWFLVPLVLPTGSLTRVDSLVVTDSFGIRTLLRPIGDRALPDPHWAMWQLGYTHRPGATIPGGEPNLFFLPPSLGDALSGPVLEDVLFMRDETANLAWGIERTLESPIETAAALGPYDGPDGGLTPATGTAPGPAPANGTDIDLGDGGVPSRYLLATSVPANWVPLVPVELVLADGLVADRLQVAAVLRPDGSQQVQRPQTRLLDVPGLLLFDEEVPREGARVTRARRLARWTDGSTWLWAANGVQVGRGEGSSGLRFDGLQRG
jgi:hypothetical protein